VGKTDWLFDLLLLDFVTRFEESWETKKDRMTDRKEIFCRRCKGKLGTADHDDLYLTGHRTPTQDRVILCSVCGWKTTWNFANNPKSRKKRFVNLNTRANKALYGIKTISERQREWFEEDRRLERQREERDEERREEQELKRREEERREERELERREEGEM